MHTLTYMSNRRRRNTDSKTYLFSLRDWISQKEANKKKYEDVAFFRKVHIFTQNKYVRKRKKEIFFIYYFNRLFAPQNRGNKRVKRGKKKQVKTKSQYTMI